MGMNELSWQEKQLIEHEGFRLNPYTDTEGYITGGIGHKFTKEDFQNWDDNWSDEQKMTYWKDRFEEDYSRATSQASAIAEKYGIKATEKNQYILTDMVFNLGDAGVKGFPSFLKALAKGDLDEAEFQMKNKSHEDPTPSKWYKQVPNRVNSLVKMMRSKDESSN